MSIYQYVLSISVAALMAVVPGCRNNGPPTTELRGTVTYAGEAVENGVLRLIPIDRTDVPASAATIKNGRFAVKAHGGVPPGPYRVEITAWRDASPKSQIAKDSAPIAVLIPEAAAEQYVPAKWNRNSELRITVTPDSDREVDFHL